jgi:hypothetical protein
MDLPTAASPDASELRFIAADDRHRHDYENGFIRKENHDAIEARPSGNRPCRPRLSDSDQLRRARMSYEEAADNTVAIFVV